MKKQIILITTSFIVSLNLWAQACPLTNAKLTDLRVASMKLAQKVSLSPRCQKFEEQVNSASSKLADLSTKIETISEGEYSIKEKHTTAIAAVTQLNAVTSVFNDKTCGKELAGFSDYVGAFADVANGLSPFLALYGGTSGMPWAIGTALAGTTVKSIVTFFQSKDIDMRNPEQSAAFIQNSCSFYDLDLLKTSIDDLQMNKFSKIEEEIEKGRNKLGELDANKPSEPKNDYKLRLSEALVDGERIRYLSSSFQRMPSKPVSTSNPMRTNRMEVSSIVSGETTKSLFQKILSGQHRREAIFTTFLIRTSRQSSLRSVGNWGTVG